MTADLWPWVLSLPYEKGHTVRHPSLWILSPFPSSYLFPLLHSLFLFFFHLFFVRSSSLFLLLCRRVSLWNIFLKIHCCESGFAAEPHPMINEEDQTWRAVDLTVLLDNENKLSLVWYYHYYSLFLFLFLATKKNLFFTPSSILIQLLMHNNLVHFLTPCEMRVNDESFVNIWTVNSKIQNRELTGCPPSSASWIFSHFLSSFSLTPSSFQSFLPLSVHLIT